MTKIAEHPTSSFRVSAAKAASRVRRRILGFLMRFAGDDNGDPSSLLARFP